MAEPTKVNVAVINASAYLKDKWEEVYAAVAALTIQVERDFAPVWGRNANIALGQFTDKNARDLKRMAGPWWWLVLLDETDRPDSQGYHDVTNVGMPLGKVFVKTSEDAGRPWTMTASHELLEMLVDPSLNLSAFKPPSGDKENDQNSGMFYGYDICDPCQEDSYEIYGKTVSNFVYPTWFESIEHPENTQFDHNRRITKPFQPLDRGFVNVLDPSAVPLGWQQVPAPSRNDTVFHNPFPGSRRFLRNLRREGNIYRGSPALDPIEVPPFPEPEPEPVPPPSC